MVYSVLIGNWVMLRGRHQGLKSYSELLEEAINFQALFAQPHHDTVVVVMPSAPT